MKYTRAEMEILLNKQGSEITSLRVEVENLKHYLGLTQEELRWHKNLNVTLVDTINAGSKEGRFPRNN